MGIPEKMEDYGDNDLGTPFVRKINEIIDYLAEQEKACEVVEKCKEKIEGLMFTRLFPYEIKDKSIVFRKNGLGVGEVAGSNYNQALQDIINELTDGK